MRFYQSWTTLIVFLRQNLIPNINRHIIQINLEATNNNHIFKLENRLTPPLNTKIGCHSPLTLKINHIVSSPIHHANARQGANKPSCSEDPDVQARHS